MRGQGWLAPGELHGHLTPRLDGKCVVEQRLDVFPGKLVYESNLVGIHETRIAHHVAPVGQVDGENRASPVLDGAAAVVVQFFVVMGSDIAAGKRFLQMPEELRINGYDIFEISVDGAILDHQDFAVALDDLRLDFTGPFVQQDAIIQFAVDNLLANLRHTTRAQRIGLPRPAQRRLRLFTGLQQRLIRPPGCERWIFGKEIVTPTKYLPRPVRSN